MIIVARERSHYRRVPSKLLATCIGGKSESYEALQLILLERKLDKATFTLDPIRYVSAQVTPMWSINVSRGRSVLIIHAGKVKYRMLKFWNTAPFCFSIYFLTCLSGLKA